MPGVEHRIYRVTPSGHPARLLQITDTHLGERPGTPLLGVDTDRSLRAVLEQSLAAHTGLDALRPPAIWPTTAACLPTVASGNTWIPPACPTSGCPAITMTVP